MEICQLQVQYLENSQPQYWYLEIQLNPQYWYLKIQWNPQKDTLE